MISHASSTFDWAWQALLVCLAAGLVFSAVVGAVLLLRPGAMMGVHRRWSRWVETGGWFATLDRMLWHWEPRIYRYHRLVGALLAGAAGFVLWQWAFAYDRAQTLRLLAPRWQAQGLDWMAAGLEWAVVLVHALALVLGVVIFIRPSLIKGLEASANRWHPSNGLVATLDRQNYAADRLFELHPRVLGLIVLCASALSLLALSLPLRLVLG